MRRGRSSPARPTATVSRGAVRGSPALPCCSDYRQQRECTVAPQAARRLPANAPHVDQSRKRESVRSGTWCCSTALIVPVPHWRADGLQLSCILDPRRLVMRQRSLLCGALAGALGVSACNGDSAWPLQDQVLVVTASGRDAGAASELEQTAVTAGQPDDAGSIDAIAVEAGSTGAASSPKWPSEEGMAGACVGELADFCGGTDCPTFDETLDEAQARGARWGTRSHCALETCMYDFSTRGTASPGR
jgi:hypothetical protein